MLRRSIYILLCIAIVFMLVVGCTPQETTQESTTASTTKSSSVSSTTTTTSTSSEPEYLKPYDSTVTITSSRAMSSTAKFDESNPEKKNYTENRWVNAFSEYLNIDLDFMWIATDNESNTSRWSTAIASGDIPDFASVGNVIYSSLLESDLIADCTQIYEQYASPDYKELLDEAALNQMTFDGVMYGVPFPTRGYMGATMLFVRQDWLDKLSLEYPSSLEDIVNVAKAFQDAELGGKDTFGLLVSSTASDGKLDGILNTMGAYHNYWIDVDGKLAWSNIQPEMRAALLKLQELYSQGIINADFSVTTPDLAKEYISGGRAGIFFSTSWNTTESIHALYANDENAEVISEIIRGENGESIKFQTNTPVVGKIYISTKCKNPEAVVKMLNLSYELTTDEETSTNYSIDLDGHMWFKYLPWGEQPRSQLADMISSYQIEQAHLSGAKTASEYEFTSSDAVGWYDSYLKAKNGDRSVAWYGLTFGIDGTYTKLYYAYQNNLHLPNGYVGLATKTQQLMGDVLNSDLFTAMLEVIMGSDISIYDDACAKWLANGGKVITDEINAIMGK